MAATKFSFWHFNIRPQWFPTHHRDRIVFPISYLIVPRWSTRDCPLVLIWSCHKYNFVFLLMHHFYKVAFDWTELWKRISNEEMGFYSRINRRIKSTEYRHYMTIPPAKLIHWLGEPPPPVTRCVKHMSHVTDLRLAKSETFSVLGKVA